MFLDDGVSRASAPKSSFLEPMDSSSSLPTALVVDKEAQSQYRQVRVAHVSYHRVSSIHSCTALTDPLAANNNFGYSSRLAKISQSQRDECMGWIRQSKYSQRHCSNIYSYLVA